MASKRSSSHQSNGKGVHILVLLHFSFDKDYIYSFVYCNTTICLEEEGLSTFESLDMIIATQGTDDINV